jgi:hypothetical protein
MDRINHFFLYTPKSGSKLLRRVDFPDNPTFVYRQANQSLSLLGGYVLEFDSAEPGKYWRERARNAAMAFGCTCWDNQGRIGVQLPYKQLIGPYLLWMRRFARDADHFADSLLESLIWGGFTPSEEYSEGSFRLKDLYWEAPQQPESISISYTTEGVWCYEKTQPGQQELFFPRLVVSSDELTPDTLIPECVAVAQFERQQRKPLSLEEILDLCKPSNPCEVGLRNFLTEQLGEQKNWTMEKLRTSAHEVTMGAIKDWYDADFVHFADCFLGNVRCLNGEEN